MRYRTALTALAAVLLIGCGDSPTEPAPPPRPNITGTWHANFEGATLNLTMTHDTLSNSINGNGTLIAGATASVALTIAGNYAGNTVSLTMSNPQYQPMNFTGSHASSTIVGTVNGSGFVNSAVTFTKG